MVGFPLMDHEVCERQRMYEEQDKRARKRAKRRERIRKTIYYGTIFILGGIVGLAIELLTGCSAQTGTYADTESTVQMIETATEIPEDDGIPETDYEESDLIETAEPEEPSEPAETEHESADASWRNSTKTHEDLNVNSVLTFDEGAIWNFSDCTAVGKSLESDITTETEADYGFTVYVKDNNTVIVKPYDDCESGIVPVKVTAEVASGSYVSSKTADTYQITGYKDCPNGLGLIQVLFSDGATLNAGIYKEDDGLYAVNVAEDVKDATSVIDCRLLFESILDKAGITEADAVYTDPIYYPIVPVADGEKTDTAYWVNKSSELVEEDWSDAHKLMAFYNYIIDNFAYDYWIISQGEHSRWSYYSDYSGKYYISQTNVGVCEDFSQVLAIMCRAQDIPALVIGNNKHAMNAVYIEDYGRWVLVDTTVDLMHDAYQEDYTIWVDDSNSKRYKHLNDVSNPNFKYISIGNYKDMEAQGIPIYNCDYD